MFKEAGQTFRGGQRKGSAKDEVDEVWFGEPRQKDAACGFTRTGSFQR